MIAGNYIMSTWHIILGEGQQIILTLHDFNVLPYCETCKLTDFSNISSITTADTHDGYSKYEI